MTRALVALSLLFAGCCTTIYSRTGKPLMRTYADISQFSFRYSGAGETFTVTALRVDHSHPTAVALHGSSNLVGAIGLAIASALSDGATTASRVIAPVATGAAQFRPAPIASPTPKPVPKS